jgi:hypothetical protein
MRERSFLFLIGVLASALSFGAVDDAVKMGAAKMNPGRALRCVERIGGGTFKVLIYGNSIAVHGPKPDIGWTNDWGMAASSAENDFVHLVVRGLEEKLGKKADWRIRKMYALERNISTNVATVAEIASDVAWGPDYVVIAIGENAPAINESNAADYRRLLAGIARPFVSMAKSPKIVMRSPFWKNPARLSLLKRYTNHSTRKKARRTRPRTISAPSNCFETAMVESRTISRIAMIRQCSSLPSLSFIFFLLFPLSKGASSSLYLRMPS